MSLRNSYPTVVFFRKDQTYPGYDEALPQSVEIGDIGVALGETEETDSQEGGVLIDLHGPDSRIIVPWVEADDEYIANKEEFSILEFDERSQYGESIQSILDQIGEEGSDDTHPIEMLSTLVPIGSFLWFEGTEVPEEDGPAVVTEGMGIAEVWGDFIGDPKTGEMKVEVFVRPLTFEGTDEGTPEVRVIDPSKVYVLTKAAR